MIPSPVLSFGVWATRSIPRMILSSAVAGFLAAALIINVSTLLGLAFCSAFSALLGVSLFLDED